MMEAEWKLSLTRSVAPEIYEFGYLKISYEILVNTRAALNTSLGLFLVAQPQHGLEALELVSLSF